MSKSGMCLKTQHVRGRWYSDLEDSEPGDGAKSGDGVGLGEDCKDSEVEDST